MLGPEMAESPASIALSMITNFSKDYTGILDGESKELSSQELSGGARISFVFHEIFKNGVNAIDPFDQIKDADIRTIMHNTSGSAPSLFVGTQAFEVLVRQQIKRLEEPSIRCINLIFDELVRILSQIISQPQYSRYPGLKEQLSQNFILYLRDLLIPTTEFVNDIIQAEETYVNTAHPDLLKGHKQCLLWKRSSIQSHKLLLILRLVNHCRQVNNQHKPHHLNQKMGHLMDSLVDSFLAKQKEITTNGSPTSSIESHRYYE